MNAVLELEALKPIVEQKIDELSRKHTHQINGRRLYHQGSSLDYSPEWSNVKNQNLNKYAITKVQLRLVSEIILGGREGIGIDSSYFLKKN